MKLLARVIPALAVSALTLGAAPSFAQAWPNKPIRIITLATPSGSDTLSRVIASKLQERVGQSGYVDNRPGAGGTIAVLAGKNAPADGYNFLVTPNVLTIAPWTTKNIGYDPIKDFAPIGRIGYAPLAFIVSPNNPAKTFPDFVKLVRSQPGKWDYASPGVGTPQHLSIEYIKQQLGLRMVHIPYPQSGTAVLDISEGRVAGGVFAIQQAVGLAQTNKIRILAVLGDKRNSQLPDLPSLSEFGVKSLENPWVALFAPAGTPADIIERMNREMAAILAPQEVHQNMIKQGVEITTSSVADFTRQFQADYERWGKVVKEAGIKAE